MEYAFLSEGAAETRNRVVYRTVHGSSEYTRACSPGCVGFELTQVFAQILFTDLNIVSIYDS